ncbi:DMT family transporter [Magnetovibrio sp.]|uniref:DMT family transporter n=1 Tax=Magnetovibrio sp. TaxID=2024836 RepID=UPI002F951FAC
MTVRDHKLTYFATVGVFVLLWSSAFAAGKIALQVSPPQLFLGVRFLLAGVLMVGFAVLSGAYRPIGVGGWAKLAVLGAINQAGYQGLAWVAMGKVSSALAAVIISMNPIFIAIFAVPFLGERMSLRRGAGLVLGIVGVMIVLSSRIIVSGEDIGGIAIMAVSLASVVAGSILFKKWRTGAPLSVAVGGQFLSAGVLLLTFGLITEDPSQIVFGADYVWIMAYIVFGVSIGAVGLWFYLLTHGSASDASALHFLMPPFGLMYGWLLLNEQAALGDFIGIVPIAVGIWLATHKGRA